MRAQLTILTLGATLMATSASADVTVTATTVGKGGFAKALSGDSITYIKGGKMRADSMAEDRKQSTILDLDGQQMILLDHGKKEATISDMQEVQATLQKITSDEVKVSLTPTGNSKQIAGQSCDEYTLEMSVPMSVDGSTPISIATTGPACIVKNAPGAKDYESFYLKAAEQGFILTGDPSQAQRNPGHARSMTEMYRQMAKLGVPYEMEMNIKIGGEGPMAALMSKVGAMSFTTTVKSVSEDPLSDDLFVVPSDYEVKKN
ncbi:MAG: hypothetical protein GEV06_20895 [Luteitalea sp.]|nr:hypothetical protein [Luteitalea sp.]